MGCNQAKPNQNIQKQPYPVVVKAKVMDGDYLPSTPTLIYQSHSVSDFSGRFSDLLSNENRYPQTQSTSNDSSETLSGQFSIIDENSASNKYNPAKYNSDKMNQYCHKQEIKRKNSQNSLSNDHDIHPQISHYNIQESSIMQRRNNNY